MAPIFYVLLLSKIIASGFCAQCILPNLIYSIKILNGKIYIYNAISIARGKKGT